MAQTTEFSLRAHLFGTTPGTLGADSRVFRVDMLVPVDKSNLNASMMAIIRQITDDLKHSCPMGCEFCAKPARESLLGIGAWPDLPPRGQPWKGSVSSGPAFAVYLHCVCSMRGKCGDAAIEEDKDIRKEHGMPPAPPDPRLRGTGQLLPLNGSCAACKSDPGSQKLLKCGTCKTVAYCSSGCQKSDWKRHKITCKWIKGSDVMDGSGPPKIWKEHAEPFYFGGAA